MVASWSLVLAQDSELLHLWDALTVHMCDLGTCHCSLLSIGAVGALLPLTTPARERCALPLRSPQVMVSDLRELWNWQSSRAVTLPAKPRDKSLQGSC